jgi:ABC-type amino acid transport substrate-binding protein
MSITDKLKYLNAKIELKAAVFLTILGFLVTNIVTFEGLRTHDLEAVLAAERAAYDSDLRQRDKDIEGVLPDQLDKPLLTYPHNGASLVTNYIRLQWREGKQQTRARNYTVEVIAPGRTGSPDFANPQFYPATDPLHMSTTLRLDIGSYLWRVKRGADDSDAEWSPYFYFDNFATSKKRIEQTGILMLGTFLPSMHSEIECQNHQGQEMPVSDLKFDNIIINAICMKLANRLHFKVIRFVKYPTADTLVFSGVKDGNVDLAVSALSDTTGRKTRGVSFSQEYLENHLVLATRAADKELLSEGARVGVVRGGTNAEFAWELSRRQLISIAEAESLQELLRMLENKEVSAIIVDEPIIDTQIKSGEVVVRDHLTRGFGGLMNRLRMPTATADARVGLAVAVHDRELEAEINQLLDESMLNRVKQGLYNKD